jgi:hypothetical protein
MPQPTPPCGADAEGRGRGSVEDEALLVSVGVVDEQRVFAERLHLHPVQGNHLQQLQLTGFHGVLRDEKVLICRKNWRSNLRVKVGSGNGILKL